MRFFLWIFFMISAIPVLASEFKFDEINGGKLSLSDFRGKAVLIVNTASRCGFTSQYAGLQKLYDRYREQGLVVIAVPSGDFRQELEKEDMVKQFCEINYGLTVPMTSITNVRGPDAHPFYKWAKLNYGRNAIPKWNFHKIIINRQGKVATTFGSITNPSSKKFINTIEKLI